MRRKIAALCILSCLAAAACASDKPHVVELTRDTEEIRLTSGMATQIEMPDGEHVKSVVTGNPALVVAEAADDVVNLIPEKPGETNLIVRVTDSGREAKVYQYRVYISQ